MPKAGQLIRIGEHIKRSSDSAAACRCSFAFDLWSHDDVSRHADAMLAQLRARTMPCDGLWPAARVDVLQRWIEDGKPMSSSDISLSVVGWASGSVTRACYCGRTVSLAGLLIRTIRTPASLRNR